MSGADGTSIASIPLGRNVSFHLLWSSTFASGMGDRLAMVTALALLGYAKPGVDSSTVQSGIDFFFFLPYLLWSPFAGWLADRVPRKWLMFVADEMRGVIVLLSLMLVPLATNGAIDAEHRWLVWSMILAVGMMAATFVPAKLSIVPNVVGLGPLTRANAAVVCMGIIGNLIGFLVAYALIEQSIESVIWTAAGCYMISGLFWIFLKTPWPQHRAATTLIESGRALHGPIVALKQITGGAHYAWSHRPVRVLIYTSALVWTGTAIYMPSLAVVNTELYGGDLQQLLLLTAPVGIGMLLGSLILGVINTRLGSELLIATGLAGCGLFIGLQVIVPHFGLGVAIALMTGVSAGLLMVPLNTLLQRITADRIRGRVFAAKEVLTELGKVIIAGSIWSLPQSDPLIRPITGAMAIALIAIAIYGVRRYAMVGPAPTPLLNLLWRIIRLYTQAVHNLRVRGRHHLPRSGPVLLVSNHHSGLDPMLIQAALPRMIRWMMAREFMLPVLNWIWKRYPAIGVRRQDRDSNSVRRAIEFLREGQIVGIFPEGRLNRDRTQLQAFGSGAATIAQRGGSLVLPVYVGGTPEAPTAWGSYWRPSNSVVVVGEPFAVDEHADRDELTRRIRDRIDELRQSVADDRAAE